MDKYLFTSESVSEGHPDKIADKISDSILDAFLTEDKNSRVAAETLVTTGLVVVSGEIRSNTYVEIKDIVRSVIKNIGYNAKFGFDGDTCGVLLSIDSQSPDIAMGVDSKIQGAGDQGIMFGYACNETETFMPAPIYYSHKLMENLANIRKNKEVGFLGPDSKSQVTFSYEDGVAKHIASVLISSQHTEMISSEDLFSFIKKEIIDNVIPESLLRKDTKFFVNPTGRFVLGGPIADTGLTGRKIIVDSYGGIGRHGGGAFSGKDPSKVDRSAAYMMRYIAKNLVAAGLAKKLEVQVSYAIGVAEPVSIFVDSFNTGIISDRKIEEIIKKEFDLRPSAIIEKLKLLRPIYSKTSNYGHFGRELKEFTWEKLDSIEKIQKYI